eukprot:3632125-Prymnesium_polylepis.1
MSLSNSKILETIRYQLQLWGSVRCTQCAHGNPMPSHPHAHPNFTPHFFNVGAKQHFSPRKWAVRGGHARPEAWFQLGK